MAPFPCSSYPPIVVFCGVPPVRWPGSVTLHPFLSPVGMRCAPSCSGAGKPTPDRAGLQSWPSASNRTLFRCLTLQKFPGYRGILFCIAAFSMVLGPITQPAWALLPGAGAPLDRPGTGPRRGPPRLEHRGIATHTAWESFGSSVTLAARFREVPFPFWRFRLPLP